MRILTAAILATSTLLALPAAAQQPASRYALVVEGVSGSDEFAVQHASGSTRWSGCSRASSFDPTHVIVLAETPRPRGEGHGRRRAHRTEPAREGRQGR
jgi:hypothetical protein